MRANRDTIWMLLVTVIAGLASWRWGGHIPIAEGIGTDGRIYAAMAADYFGQLARGVWEYSPDYYFQRSLPSLLVYLTLKLLALTPEPANLIAVFRGWNLAALLLSVGLYARAAGTLGLDRGMRWAGYFALFWGVNHLFIPFFYATLTDIFGFLAALSLFCAYLERRTLAALFQSLVAGFVWPVLLPLGLCLFLFPANGALAEPGPLDRKILALRWFLRPAVAALAGMGIMACVAAVAMSSRFGPKYGLPLAGLSLRSFWGIAGVGSLGVYVAVAAWLLLGYERIWAPFSLIRSLSVSRAAVALGLLLGVKVFVARVVPHGSSSNLIAVVMATTFSANQPFTFLVKHVLFFGPGFALVYWRLPRMFSQMAELGPGLWLFWAPFLLLGFDLESRHHTVLVPSLVILLLVQLQREGIVGWRVFRFLAAASIGISSLWFWVPHAVTGSDLYHQFIWGRPDALSLSLAFVALMLARVLFPLRERSVC